MVVRLCDPFVCYSLPVRSAVVFGGTARQRRSVRRRRCYRAGCTDLFLLRCRLAPRRRARCRRHKRRHRKFAGCCDDLLYCGRSDHTAADNHHDDYDNHNDYDNNDYNNNDYHDNDYHDNDDNHNNDYYYDYYNNDTSRYRTQRHNQ